MPPVADKTGRPFTPSGTLAETLANPALACFSSDDEQFLKFHGIYQQDDRDKRKTGKQYIMMIRARIPGGIIPPDQYLAFDDLSEKYGNQTLRITSRQSFQWHGVVKDKLGPLMKGLNDALPAIADAMLAAAAKQNGAADKFNDAADKLDVIDINLNINGQQVALTEG